MNRMEQTLNTLRNQGYKWNIETPVGHRVELFNEVERLDGRTEIRFVAEIDGYGNVVEWGIWDESRKIKESDLVLNADGEEFAL